MAISPHAGAGLGLRQPLLASVGPSTGVSQTLVVPPHGVFGIAVLCSVASVSGSSPVLRIGVDTSIDRSHWSNVAGDVTISAVGNYRFERHLLAGTVRIRQEITGTASPTFVSNLVTQWLATDIYGPLSGGWDNAGPFAYDTTEGFTLHGEPGTSLSWLVEYLDVALDPVEQDSGTVTVSATGSGTDTTLIPSSSSQAVWARLSFQSGLPGQDAVQVADIAVQ